MEVVPTNDGDEDDGVIWFRCPQCQGFLPKLSGADLQEPEAESSPSAADATVGDTDSAADESLPWDSPADMMAAQQTEAQKVEPETSPFLPEDDDGPEPKSAEPVKPPDTELSDDVDVSDDPYTPDKPEKPVEPSEPIHEYVAMLAVLDASDATPYRPWETYEVGQCLHHLAWEECGVVVAKEDLPGGRRIIKCFFEDAGVVRLIEQAPR